MSEATLKRREVLARLLADRGDLLVVTGLGQACYDCYAIEDSPNTFYLWGAMGGAVPMGIGMALAQPERRVMVITGDGELLMGLGSLGTAGVRRPDNLAVVVLDNERYGETGQQVTHTASGVDLAKVARDCGFADTLQVSSDNEVARGVDMARTAPGPVLVNFKVSAAPEPMALPPKDGAYLKTRFRQSVVGAAPI